MIAERYTPRNAREQEMWDFISQVETFMRSDLEQGTSVSLYHRTNFLRRLLRLHVLQRVRVEGGKDVLSALNADELRGTAQKKRADPIGMMWTAMRVLQQFTPSDVVASLNADGSTTVTLSNAEAYCRLLMKAKYLACTRPARPGVLEARYRLINNSGPLAPVSKRVQCVIDQNTDRVAFAQGVKL